jgi:demethylmenaquinone methyltransferase/2-methoxy-6-polyprenyl-1,4-benzoquinol methylase
VQDLAQVAANYNRLSRWYDLLAGESEARLRRAGLEILGVQPGENVLEIGFGTGQAILELARAVGDAGKVYGIDLSEGMSRVALDKVERAGLSSRVALACGNALYLPYPEHLLHAVFMSFTLELFPLSEIGDMLSECRRVMADEGRICVVGLAQQEQENWIEHLYGWLHHRYPKVIDCRPISVGAALSAAGFQVINHQERSLWGLRVAVVLAGHSSMQATESHTRPGW